MPVIRPIIGLALLVLMCAGCGKAPSGVAVVDLDEVAKRLGRDLSISKTVKATQNGLNQQLNQLLVNLQEKYKQQSAEFGDDPTPEQQAQLRKLNNDMTNLLAQRKRTAQNLYLQSQRELVVRFRDEVKPVAKDVAAENGFAIVIPKDTNSLLATDPSVDITEQVIAKMQANPALATPAAQPAAQPETKPAAETVDASAPKRTPGRTRVSEKSENSSRKG
ncbi:MAG: OmpH family outer membrane protein [Planctomycetota bacterium]|nr:OmpH family outer membrane protein [Planctomycetota bacterium]MDA1213967.1 OmpH family outer membrane protein [Planctomycetota bacterium]